MKKLSLLILMVLVFSMLSSFAYADMGPKPKTPSVTINIFYKGDKVSINDSKAVLLYCAKGNELSENEKRLNFIKPFSKLPPQLKDIFKYDSKSNCYWVPYPDAWFSGRTFSFFQVSHVNPFRFKSELKLAVYVPSLGKTFISNEFKLKNLDNSYNVSLESNGSSKVIETTPLLSMDIVRNFIIALVITLIIELSLAFLYILGNKLPWKILFSVFIGNLISLPVVWFVIPHLIKSQLPFILVSEAFAILFEGYFIHLINKKTLSLKNALVLTLLINIASFIIGEFAIVLEGLASSPLFELIILLVCGAVVALVYVLIRKLPFKVWASAAFGELVFTASFYLSNLLLLSFPEFILLLFFAIMFGVGLIYYINKQAISLKESLVLSVITILCGFFIALLLL